MYIKCLPGTFALLQEDKKTEGDGKRNTADRQRGWKEYKAQL